MHALFFPIAYVPLTVDVTIVVDGILASCYTDFNHDLAHFTMKPMQWISEVMEWMFGEDTGFSVLVNNVKELGILMLWIII